MKRVVVGLSGGVDSSVAALLLKKKGYEVIGLFMHNWDNYSSSNNQCTWLEDSIDAMLVSKELNIPFQVIEMKKEYKNSILNYMFDEYRSGRTPNPDILCNREIKFNVFLKIAMDLGADFIATGHYVNKKIIIKNNKIIYRLLIGKDSNKDQSYFLCQLTQYQLEKSIFPLGMLTKNQVRKIAEINGLCNAKKKDSQGLCFVGKIKLSKFLQQEIIPKKGEIINIDSNASIYKKKKRSFLSKEEELFFLSKNKKYKKSDGKLIGYHKGAQFFTKGQRKGISVGGYKKALFVLETDIQENIVYTGMGKTHPGLYKKSLFIKEKDIHWIREDLSLLNGEKMEVFCRIRYRQPLQKSLLYKMKNGMFIEFETMQCAITEGQFAVWYLEKELIGSGVIS
ncbi:MAG: tRNA 2-thiouridine(34) synthase MnmA [Flavobacteriales bacterium]|jgi:tRNA-specific 2-thiouridylase|uniref:tRNA 2-thiouridine(34) synthase MnmA n=1 Tax=Blattabacterium sp. (Mastotermes darwiniensis) TaxID=39768 RepID=UPI000231DE13|nr:tRNA 2-thiouridine(34) synthase MnmA [Blattabacterium sp. (Mastotermes darwiniensis)]AER40583.1 tRNA(5-methylaminomethyl-2-thiouridylate)-methyltransferase [Blattabacterium sp. (Mastotermes darwiniensis) str. MADAR]MDR1805080.1 tRNA 2-thiouridine(34) synthase MnmA [Flavobacteriales bacterium]